MTNQPNSPAKTDESLAPEVDAGVLKLAAQAAFLQAFAEGLAEPQEQPIEEVLPEKPRGEIDFGWRAGLRL